MPLTYTLDFAKLSARALTVLMIAGVVGFTSVSVGVILLLTQSDLKFTWRR